jgi:predicted DNA-binding protein YlxM (UPF0122 family)
MMAKGYSSLFIQSVKDANPNLIGVKLAKLCIKNDVSVITIANHFGVSRMSVYAWFRGERHVGDRHLDKMNRLIEKLS